MSLKVFVALSLTAYVLVLTPAPAHAIPAITCHCFTDRSFDAAKPAAADAYFLAATQNAFFAFVFNADKKSIVMMKQQGIPADDLWVAYGIADRASGEPDSLLRARMAGRSWPDVLAPMRLSPEQTGKRFSAAVAANLPPARLAAAIVDELLVGYRLLDEEQLGALRKAGASSQELILSVTLSARTGQSPLRIFQEAKAGAVTWSAMLYAAGLDSKNLQQAVSGIFQPYSKNQNHSR